MMDYRDWMRAIILNTHCPDFNPKYQHAYIKLEGTKGAVRINMALLTDDPKVTPDVVEFISKRLK
jgi:hypothetical protein